MANLPVAIIRDDATLDDVRKMIKKGGDVAKGLMKTGENIADKVLTKSGDFSAAMVKLTSKLSDDIGVMADRILKMADRIGDMADRIERTEVLMAKLTAALANRDLELAAERPVDHKVIDAAVLDVRASEATEHSGPPLSVTGDPQRYLLYVSSSPLFQDGKTVVSLISDPDDYDASWKRSIAAIRALKHAEGKENADTIGVAVAVKAESENNRFTPLSNSVDVTVVIGA